MGVMGEAAGVLERREGDVGDRAVRVGLVAYGVTHLIVAALALPIVWGDGSGRRASQQGAFRQLAESTGGRAALWVVAAGFAALVAWQILEAVRGHRSHDGIGRAARRGVSAGRALVYAVIGWTAASTAAGSGSGRSTDSRTAQLMSAPGGRWLVGLIGVGVVAVGVALVVVGLTRKFTDHLDAQATSGSRRTPVALLGSVGYAAKGAALATIGSLFVTAAVQHQPKESGGLDVALRELGRQPAGTALLLAVAVGIGAFGLYCFAWARHLDR